METNAYIVWTLLWAFQGSHEDLPESAFTQVAALMELNKQIFCIWYYWFLLPISFFNSDFTSFLQTLLLLDWNKWSFKGNWPSFFLSAWSWFSLFSAVRVTSPSLKACFTWLDDFKQYLVGLQFYPLFILLSLDIPLSVYPCWNICNLWMISTKLFHGFLMWQMIFLKHQWQPNGHVCVL